MEQLYRAKIMHILNDCRQPVYTKINKSDLNTDEKQHAIKSLVTVDFHPYHKPNLNNANILTLLKSFDTSIVISKELVYTIYIYNVSEEKYDYIIQCIIRLIHGKTSHNEDWICFPWANIYIRKKIFKSIQEILYYEAFRVYDGKTFYYSEVGNFIYENEVILIDPRAYVLDYKVHLFQYIGETRIIDLNTTLKGRDYIMALSTKHLSPKKIYGKSYRVIWSPETHHECDRSNINELILVELLAAKLQRP
jgi:hypothetical protein